MEQRALPEAKRRSDEQELYRNVLDNVASGVLSVDSSGVVRTFNRAASVITGLPTEEVLGRTFAEVFVPLEGAEEFSEVILDAAYQSAVGRQRVVEVTFEGRSRTLSTVTSHLRREHVGGTIGIVAVFSDLSEIQALRNKEGRLARDLQTKNTELREAYLNVEGKNEELNAALKRVHALRMVGAASIVALFAGVGVYAWNPGIWTDVSSWLEADSPSEKRAVGVSTMVVEPRHVSSTITIAGRLAPRRSIEVTSPITGKVAAVHFEYGQRVNEGQRLVEMDVADVRIEHDEARVSHKRALDRMTTLENWSDDVDVSRTRRSVSKGRVELETARNRVAETQFLLKRGIIPASEHEAAEREMHNRELDLRSAEQDLDAILAKGETDLEVTRLELNIARARLERLEDTLSNALVHAPVDGVVLRPGGEDERSQSGKRAQILARGVTVSQGQGLVTIGDLGGMTVIGSVDEVDVTRVAPGQRTRILGEAFSDLELEGTIIRVSSQATNSDLVPSLAMFDVAAVVNDLEQHQLERLRVGMSALLEVEVYDKDDALLVPLSAVNMRLGEPHLKVRGNSSGEYRDVRVVTGVTTVDSVEIVQGIAAGDEIAVSER